MAGTALGVVSSSSCSPCSSPAVLQAVPALLCPTCCMLPRYCLREEGLLACPGDMDPSSISLILWRPQAGMFTGWLRPSPLLWCQAVLVAGAVPGAASSSSSSPQGALKAAKGDCGAWALAGEAGGCCGCWWVSPPWLSWLSWLWWWWW